MDVVEMTVCAIKQSRMGNRDGSGTRNDAIAPCLPQDLRQWTESCECHNAGVPVRPAALGSRPVEKSRTNSPPPS